MLIFKIGYTLDVWLWKVLLKLKMCVLRKDVDSDSICSEITMRTKKQNVDHFESDSSSSSSALSSSASLSSSQKSL